MIMVKLQLCVLALGLLLVATDAGLVSADAEQQIVVISAEETDFQDDPEETPGYFEGDLDVPKLRNFVTQRTQLWEQGIVYYAFAGDITSQVRSVIQEAMNQIASNSGGSKPCIRFLPKTPRSPQYVTFRKLTGCHSPVGKLPPQYASDISIGTGCDHVGIVIHEILHTLGFFHEQSRLDRDSYVDIFVDNVKTGFENNFKKLTANSQIFALTSYDYRSIMHYKAYSFTKDSSKPTIAPKASRNYKGRLGQRTQMSVDDVRELQRAYSCPEDVSHIAKPPSNTYYFKCGFEDATNCGITQEKTDNFDWTRVRGNPPGGLTNAPGGDADNGGGSYMFASAKGHGGQHAVLVVPTRKYSGPTCFQFQVATGGPSRIMLEIEQAGSRKSIKRQTVFRTGTSSMHGWRRTAVNMNLPAGVDLNIYLNADIGSGSNNHVALDLVEFYKGNCNNK